MKSVIVFILVLFLVLTAVPVYKVVAQVDISNTPDNWHLGTISTNSTYQTDFIVTNSGNVTINITISASNMTGGIPWTLSDNASPGTDIYGLRACLDGESFDIIANGNGNELVPSLNATDNQTWSLQFLSPTSFSDYVEKSGNVTLTATQIE